MQALSDTTYRKLTTLMYDTIGLSFNDSKKPLVSSRLAPRIQRLGIGDFDDYLALIAGPDDGGAFQLAIDLLTTNETYFFRAPAHHALIEQTLARSKPRALAVWGAGSSFGDEAYSTAMLLADLQHQGRIGPDWQILGTDISDRVLRSAGETVYPEDLLRDVSPERLGPFDIIFVRNVLICFDPPNKSAVVDRALTQLRPGGLFFIGTAEGRVPCSVALQTVGPGAFRKPLAA